MRLVVCVYPFLNFANTGSITTFLYIDLYASFWYLQWNRSYA